MTRYQYSELRPIYDLLQSKGEHFTVELKCNLGPAEDGSVEMSCHFITSLIRFANMMLLACHVQASTRVGSFSRDVDCKCG